MLFYSIISIFHHKTYGLLSLFRLAIGLCLWYSDLVNLYAPVAQLDRVSDSDSEGRGFESRRAYHNRNIKKICSAKTPILSGFFAAQTPGFGDAYS